MGWLITMDATRAEAALGDAAVQAVRAVMPCVCGVPALGDLRPRVAA